MWNITVLYIEGKWDWCISGQRDQWYFNSQGILQRLLGAVGISLGEEQV